MPKKLPKDFFLYLCLSFGMIMLGLLMAQTAKPNFIYDLLFGHWDSPLELIIIFAVFVIMMTGYMLALYLERYVYKSWAPTWKKAGADKPSRISIAIIIFPVFFFFTVIILKIAAG